MTITRRDPGTIFLGGERTQINDLATSEVLTPGMLVERDNTAGVIRWKKHTGGAGATVVTERQMMNEGVSDTIPVGDLVEVSALHKGATAWMFIPSGQDIAAGAELESAGNGYLRAKASDVALFIALENKPNVTELTRIRVEAV